METISATQTLLKYGHRKYVLQSYCFTVALREYIFAKKRNVKEYAILYHVLATNTSNFGSKHILLFMV